MGSAVSLLQSEPLFFLSASISSLLFLLSFVLLLLDQPRALERNGQNLPDQDVDEIPVKNGLSEFIG